MIQLIVTICFTIGLFKILTMAYKLVAPLIAKKKDLFERYGGGWVVATGASEGIGLAMCKELASMGFNIFIMSRSIDKLEAAKLILLKINPKIAVKILSVDFTALRTEEAYQPISAVLASLNVSILINNVGALNPDQFIKTDLNSLRNETILNCIPIAAMTRLLIPSMSKRSMSAIVNVSSITAVMTYNCWPNYTATKVFDDYISRAVSQQISNIDILSCLPSFVSSSLTKNTKSFLHITPEQCARGCLRQLGNAKVTHGHWLHHFVGIIIQQIPQFLRNALVIQGVREFREQFYSREKEN